MAAAFDSPGFCGGYGVELSEQLRAKIVLDKHILRRYAVGMSKNHGLIINFKNEDWKILGQGTIRDGKVYCHLASLTRGTWQKNGFRPIQMADWVDQNIILASAIRKEEAQRKEFAKKHTNAAPCVPWRGAGGDIGACIYCGEPVR